MSTVFEFIDVLSRSASWGNLSPVRECNRLVETIGYDAVEYCWPKLKRLGRIHGTTREREWDEMLSACKRARYDSDGDAVMESVEPLVEYAECPATPEAEVEAEPGPAEPIKAYGESNGQVMSKLKVEPEPVISPVGLVNNEGESIKIEVEPEIDFSLVGLADDPGQVNVKVEIEDVPSPAEPVVVDDEQVVVEHEGECVPVMVVAHVGPRGWGG